MGLSQEKNVQIPPIPKLELPHHVEREIRRAIEGLAFGSVEIVVHDSKVVQIERKEKVRFN